MVNACPRKALYVIITGQGRCYGEDQPAHEGCVEQHEDHASFLCVGQVGRASLCAVLLAWTQVTGLHTTSSV